ncbi:hypothetical protein FP744_10003492 [Trichoderma asperellum]|nr:hypothetical protein LI328DRAFT_146182 [Trichoderma asperelloides]
MTTKQLDLDDDKYFKQEYPGLKETRSYLQHAKLSLRTTLGLPSDKSKDPKPRLNSSDELIDANLPNAREAERFSSRAFGKQFIVTFFNFDNQHWVAAISDQAEGHLYVYDTTCTIETGRLEPRRAAWPGKPLPVRLQPVNPRGLRPPIPLARQGTEALVYIDQPQVTALPIAWLFRQRRTKNTEPAGQAEAKSHHILCNELGLGSLTELREKLPAEKLPTDKRKDECYDSRFCESVTGEPISLVLSKKGPWRSKEAVDGHALLYVKEEQDDGGAL